MPALGMAQETGKLLRWIKAEGEAVAKGEPLMEVETDKVTVEIEAPADGILGGVIARPRATTCRSARRSPTSSPPARRRRSAVAVAAAAAAAATAGAAVAGGRAPPRQRQRRKDRAAGSRRALASPKARRLAREHGVPIEEIAGSGPARRRAGGRRARLHRRAVAAARDPPRGPRRARGLVRLADDGRRGWPQSWQEVPHFYLQRDVDATRLELVARRRRASGPATSRSRTPTCSSRSAPPRSSSTRA